MGMRAISRYNIRTTAKTLLYILSCYIKGEVLDGPEIKQFEEEFAAYEELPYAITAGSGRMAFYYILKALNLPIGSEIIFPAFTFWVIPAMAKAAGMKPVFIDIKPDTFNMDPEKIESAITDKTRVIIPTHIYGQPCEMDKIMEIGEKHNLIVIEDCAHAIGATYKGKKTGTFGRASFTSFQSLKCINCFGGGMVMTSDPEIASKVRIMSYSEPFPGKWKAIRSIIAEYIESVLLWPEPFFYSIFPILYLSSLTGNYNRITLKVWEKIRPLSPIPKSYRKRFTNLQAKIGLKSLEMLDHLNDLNRANAEEYDNSLGDIPAIKLPAIVEEGISNYYQYCIKVSDPYKMSQKGIRRGIDLCHRHIDICNTMELFMDEFSSCPNAEYMENSLQVPVYADLKEKDLRWIIKVIRQIAKELPPIDA